MTNKPMLSVERDLLEEMLAAMKEVNSLPVKYYGSTLGDRVRAILEGHSEQSEQLAIGTLHRDCDERIVFESSGEIHIKDGMQVYDKPAAQHQGYPVNRLSYSQGDRRYVNGWNDACSHWEEKPAPVAVVLPPEIDRDYFNDESMAGGWNECREEVARLNGVKL